MITSSGFRPIFENWAENLEEVILLTSVICFVPDLG